MVKKGFYRHFKGNIYEVIDVAKHSETLEEMVVYRALYGEGEVWVRPLSMWNETVEREGKTFYYRCQEKKKNSTGFRHTGTGRKQIVASV